MYCQGHVSSRSRSFIIFALASLTLFSFLICKPALAQSDPAPDFAFSVKPRLGGGYYPWGEGPNPQPSVTTGTTGNWNHEYTSARGFGATFSTVGQYSGNTISYTETATIDYYAQGGSQLYEGGSITDITIFVRKELFSPKDSLTPSKVIIRRSHTRELNATSSTNVTSKGTASVYRRNAWEAQTSNGNGGSDFGTVSEIEHVDSGTYCGVMINGTDYCRVYGLDTSAAIGIYKGPYDPLTQLNATSRLTSTFSVKLLPGTTQATDSEEGNDDDDEKECLRKGLNMNNSKGFASIELTDPVKTRGYPLKNNIHVRSLSARNVGMGNLPFSYGIKVTKENRFAKIQNYRGSSSYGMIPHYFLIDGDGSSFNYGRVLPLSSITDSSTLNAPFIGGTLTATDNGYTLTNAGPPEQIEEFGHYSYAFDKFGKLLRLTDPAGNIQELTYQEERLIRVDDLSSGRALTFSHNSTGQISEVVQNGGPRTVIDYTPLNLAEKVTTYNIDASVAHTIALTYDDEFRLASAEFDNDDKQRYTFRYEPRPNLLSTKGTLDARIPVMQTIPSGPGIERVS
jgi:YD repeat-containing protein